MNSEERIACIDYAIRWIQWAKSIVVTTSTREDVYKEVLQGLLQLRGEILEEETKHNG